MDDRPDLPLAGRSSVAQRSKVPTRDAGFQGQDDDSLIRSLTRSRTTSSGSCMATVTELCPSTFERLEPVAHCVDDPCAEREDAQIIFCGPKTEQGLPFVR